MFNFLYITFLPLIIFTVRLIGGVVIHKSPDIVFQIHYSFFHYISYLLSCCPLYGHTALSVTSTWLLGFGTVGVEVSTTHAVCSDRDLSQPGHVSVSPQHTNVLYHGSLHKEDCCSLHCPMIGRKRKYKWQKFNFLYSMCHFC